MNATMCAARRKPAVASLTRYIRFALAASALTLAMPAFAQDSAPAASDAKTLDAVQVTGSRIQRTNTDTETAQPITVVRGEVFAERGFINVAEAINDLPQVIGSQTDVGDQEGSSTGKQFINLFNLGSQRTLTLVNGRRFVSSNAAGGGGGGSQVDMNNIPASLIDRIEVVQATGSAVYGSDAVAGVVNVILKDKFEGVELDAQTGLSSRGDYERHAFSLTGGTSFADGRGSIMGNLDWSKTGELMAADRRWSSYGLTFAPNPANTSDSDGIPASIATLDHRMSEHPEGGTLYSVPAPLAQFRIDLDGSPVRFDANGNLVPYDVGRYAQPAYAFGGEGLKISQFTALRTPVDRKVFTGLGHYDISNSVRLSAEVNYARMEAFEPINQGAYNSALLTTTPSGALRFTTDNPFLSNQASDLLTDNGVSAFWLSRFHTDLMPSSGAGSQTTTSRAVVALDGDFEAADRFFNWSVSANLGKARGSYYSYGILQENFLYAIDAVRDGAGNIVCRATRDNPGSSNALIAGCTPLNLFGMGVASQESRDYITGLFGADYETRQNNYQLNFSGEVMQLPAGTLAFATGYEYRKEHSDYRPFDASLNGLGRSAATDAMSGQYHTSELYGELLVPVLGGDVTFGPITGLEFDASYRTVDNSLAGDNEAISSGFRMNLFNDLTVRGTWNKTFRAPAIYELFLPQTTTWTNGIDPCDSRYIATGADPALRAANCHAALGALGVDTSVPFDSLIVNIPTEQHTGGNPDLRNELAESWTVGLVYQPRQVEGLTLALDVVNMKIRDAISFFDGSAVMQACYDQPMPNEYCSRFQRGADGQIIGGTMQTGYTNAGYVDMASTSFNANWALPLSKWFEGRDFGRLDLGLNVMQMRKLNISVSGLGFDEYDAVGTGLLASSIVGPTPEYQARFNTTWARGPLTLNWSTQWYDAVVYDHSYTIETRDILGIPSTVRHDVSAQYKVNDRLSLRFVVNNLFDKEPPINVNVGAGNYNATSDLVGTYYNAGLHYRF